MVVYCFGFLSRARKQLLGFIYFKWTEDEFLKQQGERDNFWGRGESKQAQGNSLDVYGANRSRVYYGRQVWARNDLIETLEKKLSSI